MKIILALVVVVWSCHATVVYDIDNAETLFEDFINAYSKVYKSEDEKQMRFNIFKENLKSINAKNQQQDGAEFGINMFTDLKIEEVHAQYTGLKISDDTSCETTKSDKDIPDANAPSSWDWRSKQVLNPIKNQGSCGSCWAFSTVASVESAYAIKHNKRVVLSEQQLVDCDKYDSGCGGGLMSTAFRYFEKAGGVDSESGYPYKATRGTCSFKRKDSEAKVKSCVSYDLTSSDKVKQLLYANGPYSIGIQADAIVAYTKGIISAKACDSGPINHAVNLVGYGSDNGKDYWIVRNSWGKSFGEDGYFRMERGEGVNTCKFMNVAMASVIVE